MVGGPHTFQGDARFSISRELGRGGTGIVYEAYDHERDETVALKTLHWANAEAIGRFKREFRTLAGVAHVNLVQLYELIARQDAWFFTMELVHGRNFYEYVRPGSTFPVFADATTEIAAPTPTPSSGPAPHRGAVRSRGVDILRLRYSLRQLVEGIAALHRADKIHRDVKPLNVLVAESGRVVILDFGIATDKPGRTRRHSLEAGLFGTVEYMSPEQCLAERCQPASDWYSVGVLLYEALTGRPPFTGSVQIVMHDKLTSVPAHPGELAPDLPPDLTALCLQLLARDPEQRPTDADLLRAMGLSEPAVVLEPHAPSDEITLVGRGAALAQLRQALDTAATGHTVATCVHGPSGIGKSTLIRHFTETMRDAGRALVCDGRCYVRESVPFKALDEVIDALSTALAELPPDQIEARLPAHAVDLARMFPSLRRVAAIERRVDPLREVDNHRELRRQAFAALTELLRLVAEHRPVIVTIDDLQWADQDSIDVLDGLLTSLPDSPLLFLLSFRSEEIGSVPFLQHLLARVDGRVRHSLPLGPLTESDAIGFARARLGAGRPDAEGYARTLARESAGNPFLLDQIVRFVRDAGGARERGSFDLQDMLSARLAQMPAGARDLVQVLAIAAQPVDATVAYRAAGLEGDERPLVASLRIAHLVRASADDERVDLYHDRLRDAVLEGLDAAATLRIHRRIAEELEAKGIDDAEALYTHYLGAGETARAAAMAAQAAEAAIASLAFERAAQFYQRALDLTDGASPEATAWNAGLGDALAATGRTGPAAEAYLRASRTASTRAVLDLERRAGQQLLIGGRIDDGLEVIGRVLRSVGLSLPPTPFQALLALIARRVRLRLRGRSYVERTADSLPPDQLTRIDTCWAVAEGMALVDNIQGAAFQSLHLLLALDAGEPHRVARALAMEAGFIASSGSAEEARRLLLEAEDLGRRLDSQPTIGLCKMIGAVLAFHQGRIERAEELVRQAETILAGEQSPTAWQLNIARVYHIPILVELGDVAEIRALTEAWLHDALDRGSRFTATMFRSGWGCLTWLSEDDVAGAREALAQVLDHRPKGRYYLPDFYAMLSQVLIDLYAGDGIAAYRTATRDWRLLQRSQLLRIKRVRTRYLQVRAGCAIAAARAGTDPERLLRWAERDARWIERQRHTMGKTNQAHGHLLQAAVHSARGKPERALEHLQIAVDAYKASGSKLYGAAAKRRMGELLGGARGATLIEEADAWMATEDIRRPARMTRALAPGFPDPPAGRPTPPPPASPVRGRPAP